MKDIKVLQNEGSKETTEIVSKEDQIIFEKGLDVAYSIIYKTKTPCKA